MRDTFVPDIVIKRLPAYLQVLNQMAKEGLHTVSSVALADRVGTTGAQIRKDLSYFGGFGKQGTGYSIYVLIEELHKILHLDKIWRVAVVGAGNLGRALTRYQGFANRGIDICLLFDNHPSLIGTKVDSLIIQHVDSMEKAIPKQNVKIAILTLPGEAAQSTAEILVKAGIQAILNYTPATLKLPKNVHVENIDPVLQLQRMMFYLEED
jgi:redox-sensing transcriptional repressor